MLVATVLFMGAIALGGVQLSRSRTQADEYELLEQHLAAAAQRPMKKKDQDSERIEAALDWVQDHERRWSRLRRPRLEWPSRHERDLTKFVDLLLQNPCKLHGISDKMESNLRKIRRLVERNLERIRVESGKYPQLNLLAKQIVRKVARNCESAFFDTFLLVFHDQLGKRTIQLLDADILAQLTSGQQQLASWVQRRLARNINIYLRMDHIIDELPNFGDNKRRLLKANKSIAAHCRRLSASSFGPTLDQWARMSSIALERNLSPPADLNWAQQLYYETALNLKLCRDIVEGKESKERV